jgi:hypothetical protein
MLITCFKVAFQNLENNTPTIGMMFLLHTSGSIEITKYTGCNPLKTKTNENMEQNLVSELTLKV